MIEFRLISTLDHSEVVSMVFALYKESAEIEGEHSTISEKQVHNTLNRTVTHPEEVQCYVFLSDTNVVGYGLLCSFWSNEYGGKVLIVDELYVLPPYRGQGIVTKFITLLTELKQYVMLDLEVFPTNFKAQNLYKRLGFSITNRVFMNKFLI